MGGVKVYVERLSLGKELPAAENVYQLEVKLHLQRFCVI